MKKVIYGLLLLLALTACGTVAPPSNTPTSTVTPTPVSTSTLQPTGPPTLTPSPTAPPDAADASGLPIFPASALSTGSGISLSFSQAVMNTLAASGINFPPEVLDDLKQGLVGQWLWLLGADGYGHVDPNSFTSLKRINAQKGAMRIWLCSQLQPNFGTATDVDLRVVLQGEYNALRDEYMARTDGCSFHTRYKFLAYGFDAGEGLIFAEKNKFTYIFYVPTGFINFRKPKDAESTVALILYALAQGTKQTIGVDVADYNNQHGNRNFEYRRKYSRSFLNIDRFYVGGIRDGAFADKGFVSKEAILGWCFFDLSTDGIANCKEGIENWNFTLLR